MSDLAADILTPQDVTALFSVSDSTLRRWEKEGLLIPARIGSHRFYSRQALVAAITPPATSNRTAV